MDRWSRVALWTLASSALTGAGCADVLGFQSFSGGGDSGPSSTGSSSNAYGGSAGTSQGAGGGGSPGSTGAGDPAGGGTSSSGDPAMGSATSGDPGASGDSATNGSTESGASSGAGGSGTSNDSSGAGGSTSAGSSSGGNFNSGGSSSGGMVASGSSGSGTGGSSSSTATSSSSSSRNPAGPCTFGTAYNGNASFTWYYFGQGPMPYKGACGYGVSESGSGQNASDTAQNIASTSPAKSTYFAAIPGSNGFNTVTSCGACVEVTNGGSKIVATIIDECPTDNGQNPKCSQTGHLDLSTQAFDALGYSTGSPSGTTWKFVACPVTGNIKAVANATGEYYLQNSVYPIASVNGQAPTRYGYFNVNPGSVTATSTVINQSITITIPSGGGDTGGNFTAPTGCY
jgi:hypothetical protein